MRVAFVAAVLICLGLPAMADTCPATGDMVLGARTPEVDLYDAAGGKRVQTLDAKSFPSCLAITGRAPNMMLQVNVGGKALWVPPYMVKYRFAGKLPQVCRNLALGTNTEKVGATRGLGEGCPKAGGK
jgi:hypothetical protein